MKISKELKFILEEQAKEFNRYFGRKPSSGDAVFFQLQALESSESIDDTMIEAMGKAGIDDGLIYAYKKCGFLLTAENRKRITTAQEREWVDAVNEFEEKKYQRKQKDLLTERAGDLLNDFFSIIFLISNILYRNRKYTKSVNSLDELTAFSGSFVLFCLAKTFKHLKSITHLLNNYHGEDSLILMRAIF